MSRKTSLRAIADDARAASAWQRTTGQDLGVGAPERGSTLVLAHDRPDLLGRVLELLADKVNVAIVADEIVPRSLEHLLVSSGFSVEFTAKGAVFASPTRDPRDVATVALAGSHAIRRFAADPFAVEATAADLSDRHRYVLTDSTPGTEWVTTMGKRSALTLDTAPRDLITPLRPTPFERFAVDQPTPGDLVLLADLGLQGSARQASGPDLAGSRVSTITPEAGPRKRDQVEHVRAWRKSALDLAIGSSGVIALSSHFRCSADRAAVVVDAINHRIPVLADDPHSLRGYLGIRTMEAMSAVKPEGFQDLFYRDQVAVVQHRSLSQDMWEAPSARIPPDEGRNRAAPPVSIVMSTIRPQLIPTALAMISRQTYPNVEVIIVLHGVDWPIQERRSSDHDFEQPMTIVVSADGERPLGSAYEAGISASSGEIVTIWDDDDYYGANHLWDLVIALDESRADLVGKGAEFFYLEASDMTVQRAPYGRYKYTDFIGGSNLTMRRADLDQLSGFASLTLGVDREIARRVLAFGGRVYRTHGYGYLIRRRRSGHTWDPGDDYFLASSVRQWPGLEMIATGVESDPG